MSEGIERFIGYEFPPSEYTVDPAKHALFLKA
ncbi:MAG: hypothetical protein JWP15_1714, partial [Alphaproteobacteria bacterium]|nr:hypothetical protein [Alphaproteobacteria bacterium]